MRRLLLLLPTLLLLAACGDDGGGGVDTGGEVRTTPVELGDGDEVWLRVHSGGGYVPEIVHLREVPGLLLFDDGRLVRVDRGEDEFDQVVPRYEEVILDEDGVADLLGRFADVVDGPDPGDPDVTDLPTTTIEVTTGGDTRELSIYALGFEDDGLTDSEEEAREAAEDAIDEAFDLDGAEPYVPEEWLLMTRFVEGTPRLDLPLEPERVASAATTALCTRISGQEVGPVLDAAEDADPVAEIVLRPVLTGDEECEDGFVER